MARGQRCGPLPSYQSPLTSLELRRDGRSSNWSGQGCDTPAPPLAQHHGDEVSDHRVLHVTSPSRLRLIQETGWPEPTLTGPRHDTTPPMTEPHAREITRRQRTPRTEFGPWTERRLRDWQRFVERAEEGLAGHLTGCPQCDGLDARDELEKLMHRGGRRRERIARRFEPLDRRFRQATTPAPSGANEPAWWRHRHHE